MPTPSLPLIILVSALALASDPSHSQNQQPASGSAATQKKQPITSVEQLPRRTVKLDKLPSQYLTAPAPSLRPSLTSLRRTSAPTWRPSTFKTQPRCGPTSVAC